MKRDRGNHMEQKHPMLEEYKGILIGILCIGLVVGACWYSIWWSVQFEGDTIEGTVTDMKTENYWNNVDYYVELNNTKWVSVTTFTSFSLEIGNYTYLVQQNLGIIYRIK
jgi:hypothetical protein